jgi:hypothetical protein
MPKLCGSSVVHALKSRQFFALLLGKDSQATFSSGFNFCSNIENFVFHQFSHLRTYK